jgi:ubiquinone/menaquinone biosynthesis C-methylase UbiE
MLTTDVDTYLAEIARLVRPGGRVVVTAFVEDGVPDETENPPEYGPLAWAGRLHCVRYDTGYLTGIIERSGFRVLSIDHATETDGQSLLILVPTPA